LKPEQAFELSCITKFSKIELVIINITIWTYFLVLIHQTYLMLAARKTAIDVEVLNLINLGEPIREIEWKTV